MNLRAWPLFLLVLSACGPKPGTEHLPDLREALMAVDSAAVRFEAADHDAAVPAHARVDSTLAVVEARMHGLVVNLDQGKPFSVLDEGRRMLKRQPGRQRRIRQEIDRTRRQIGHLMDAIVDGAKIDAEGTPIDAAYFDAAVADELRIAGHLVEEVDIALDFLERGLRDLDGVIDRADSASTALSSIPESPAP